jgi:predicted HAD superfamily Cof-like phosphohydrolase
MLKDFHEKYGHMISNYPSIPPDSIKLLRSELILEECAEMLKGIEEGSLEEIADGAADLIYVVIGTCVSYGIPIERIFIEVHRSNMSKTAVKAVDGQKYGTKTPKGPDYIPPDIKGILSRPNELTRLEKIYA